MANQTDRRGQATPPEDPALQDDSTRAEMIERNRRTATETRKNDPSLLRRLRDKMKRLKDEDPNVYPLI